MISTSDQKADIGQIIGNGWETFRGQSGYEMCITKDNSPYTISPKHEGNSTGVRTFDDGTSYQTFETGIPGLGYAMGIRAQGTSRWFPIEKNMLPINIDGGTNKLLVDVKVAFVKTVSGDINEQDNAIARLSDTTVHCFGGLNWENALGFIESKPANVRWGARSCDVKTSRVTVNLGYHDYAMVQSLSVGENFGHDSQTMIVECPRNTKVFYTIADNLHPENIGEDIIFLENSSENPGFGVQMFESGSSTPLKIGGDRNANNDYQYLFASTGNSSESINKIFDFKYIKTSNDFLATDGDAQVTVTLIYK